jgi:hypothetical protein
MKVERKGDTLRWSTGVGRQVLSYAFDAAWVALFIGLAAFGVSIASKAGSNNAVVGGFTALIFGGAALYCLYANWSKNEPRIDVSIDRTSGTITVDQVWLTGRKTEHYKFQDIVSISAHETSDQDDTPMRGLELRLKTGATVPLMTARYRTKAIDQLLGDVRKIVPELVRAT